MGLHFTAHLSLVSLRIFFRDCQPKRTLAIGILPSDNFYSMSLKCGLELNNSHFRACTCKCVQDLTVFIEFCLNMNFNNSPKADNSLYAEVVVKAKTTEGAVWPTW